MTNTQTWIHISLAVLTFSVFCIAALQAIVLHLQDRLLRHPQHKHPLMKKLPPLETMERCLFYGIALGWVLLTIMLASSVYFFTHIFQPPLLKKTLLVLTTWGIFTILLLGRYIMGWRGRKALYYTLIGFFLLIVIVFPLSL